MPSLTEHTRPRKEGVITAAMIIVVMLVGAIFLVVEASTEPYHIDELRQVGYYERPIAAVVDSSFGMEQPPLDMVTNALVQRLVGTGDLRQRAVSVGLGIGSIGLIAILALFAGMGRWGAVAGAATLALSPVTISVTAYARPYALPTFLVLAFVVLAVKWLRTGGAKWAIGIALLAVALLLSRPTEPYIFLVMAPAALLLWQIVGRAYRWQRVLYVLIVGAGTLILVGKPVMGRLCEQLDQCSGFDSQVLTQVARLWTDAPQALGGALWRPLLLGVAIAVFVIVPRARDLLVSRWWFWALAATALGATAAFFVLSDPALGFPAKYAYLYYVVVALIIGALVDAATQSDWGSRIELTSGLASGLVAIVVLVALSSSAWATVTTESRIDYGALAAMALTEAPDRVIITDSPRPLGKWRPWMYGRGRYYPRDAAFVRVDDIMKDPSVLDTSMSPAMLLIGVPTFDVDPPFETVETPKGTLIFDRDAQPGGASAADLLSAVGQSIGGDRGSTPVLAGAFIRLYSGDRDGGCVEVMRVASDPAVPSEALARVLSVDWYSTTGDQCDIDSFLVADA